MRPPGYRTLVSQLLGGLLLYPLLLAFFAALYGLGRLWRWLGH